MRRQDEDVAESVQYFALEFWRCTPELLALPRPERIEKATEVLLISNDGPFTPDSLSTQAELTCWESLSVQLFFLFALGGPIAMILAPFGALAFTHDLALVQYYLGSWAVAFLVLALHPIPKMDWGTSRFTITLYKYFTYRWVWKDDLGDAMSGSQAWCACTVPHGVLPVGTLLMCIAGNCFFDGSYLGGTASVVHYTPFLRYLMVFGPAIDVSAASIKKRRSTATVLESWLMESLAFSQGGTRSC